MATVTSPVFTWDAASAIASTFSAADASGSTANIAANACGTLFVGTTAHSFLLSSHAELAAIMMFELLGSITTDSAGTFSVAS